MADEHKGGVLKDKKRVSEFGERNEDMKDKTEENQTHREEEKHTLVESKSVGQFLISESLFVYQYLQCCPWIRGTRSPHPGNERNSELL